LKITQEPRIIQQVKIAINESIKLRIYNIHLDNQQEDCRIKELMEALIFIKSTSRGKPHLIMGDFNSLLREDYTTEEWNKITKERFNNAWEAPQTKVCSLMLSENYKDAWTLAKERKGNKETFPRYKTRIDYVWVSQNFPFQILKSSHVEHEASDHNPELIEIDIF